MKRLGLIAVTLTIACGSRSAREIWCAGMCAASQRCGASTDIDTCSRTCAEGPSSLDNLSVHGAEAEEPCLARMPCEVFDDENRWNTESAACWEAASSTIVPTPRIREVCARLSLRWFECDGAYSTDLCEHELGRWADEIGDRLAACSALTECDAFDACVDRAYAP